MPSSRYGDIAWQAALMLQSRRNRVRNFRRKTFIKPTHLRQTAARWVKVGDSWTKFKSFHFYVMLKNLPEGQKIEFSG